MKHQYAVISNPSDIDFLREKTSSYQNFVISYDEEMLELLHQHFKNSKNL